METKPLLYGLAGFFIGGLLVATAATTFDKPSEQASTNNRSKSTETLMTSPVASLKDKTGDDYDKIFIGHMIDHHESAVEMSKLSAQRAKHDEIKQLSNDIIVAQEKEIGQMKQWQKDWGYSASNDHGNLSH